MTTPIVGDTYRHTKSGKRYKILVIAKNSETLEDMVVYEALYESEPSMKVWTRPLSMFTEEVEIEGKPQPRFTKE